MVNYELNVKGESEEPESSTIFRKGVVFTMKRGINAAGHKRYYVLRRKLYRVLLSVL